MPPSIDPHLALELIQHYADGLGEGAGLATTAGAFKLLGAAFKKVVGFRSRDIGEQEQRVRAQRLLTIRDVLVEDFDNGGQFDSCLMQEERDEPAFRAFVESTLEAAAQTPTESKRLSLAKLLVKRCSAPTECFLEIQLRRAIHIIQDLSETQLYFLGALFLITYPEIGEFDSYPKYSAWLDKMYNPLLTRFLRARWDSTDLEHVQAIGAVLRTNAVSKEFPDELQLDADWESAATPLDTIFYALGLHPIPRGDSNPPCSFLYRARELFLSFALARERASEPLGEFDLSPVGQVIASGLVERMSGVPQPLTEWAKRTGVVNLD